MHSKNLMAAQPAFILSSTSGTRSVTILSDGTYSKYTMYLLTGMLGLR